jgi:integrase
VVAEQYIQEHVEGLARWAETVALVRSLVTQFGATPIAEITPEQCKAAIRKLQAEAAERSKGRRGSKGGAGLAHRLFGLLRHLMGWALSMPEFHLKVNPMAALKAATTVTGKREPRSRVLTEIELAKVWHAAEQMPVPYSQIVRMLILTGARLREITNLTKDELDLDKKLIVLSKDRTKTDVEHSIPLPPLALTILNEMPQFVGPFLFSAGGGRRPFVGFDRSKRRLDEISGVTEFTIHDLRRSARSYWSAIPEISDTVKELCLGHVQGGIIGTYDRYKYLAERRQLLERWEQMLTQIVNPPPPAVVTAPRRRRAI